MLKASAYGSPLKDRISPWANNLVDSTGAKKNLDSSVRITREQLLLEHLTTKFNLCRASCNTALAI